MNSIGKQQVAVVGGGISGLSAAWFLLKAGLRPLLIEKENRFGGLIHTDRIDGCELEAGPDSFIAAKPAVASLARELGIESEIIGSNDSARKIFIVKHGALVPMPPGMVFMIPGDLEAALRSDFFSPEAKSRFEQELNYPPRARTDDVSVRDFVVDHFGEESLDYLTEPLLSGVYGGNAGSLSARSVFPRFLEYESRFGSLIRAVREERAGRSEPHTSLFLSFRGGMQTLTDALERALSPRVSRMRAAIETVEKVPGAWRLNSASGSVETERLVLACPAHACSKFLQDAAPELSRELGYIPYSSAILVSLAFERSEFEHPLDGFGFLVPKPERRGIAAVTWISTKFPARTPPNRIALRAFIVGEEAVSLMPCTDGALVEVVRRELGRLMNVFNHPSFSTVYRWPHSMPQYIVGHHSRVHAIRELAAAERALHLCGNAYDGVGIPDCIRLASELARL